MRRWQPRNGVLWSATVTTQLRFRSDGRFRIVQFTDTHLCDGSQDDLRTVALMEQVLEAEQPELVVLTGDVIEGGRAPDPAGAWLQAVAPIEARGLPWAAVFGNHDDEGDLDRRALLEVQRSCPQCLTQPGPEAVPGLGNYVLEIGSAADGDEPAAALYFLDSHAYSPTGAGTYGWFAHEQVAWYRAASAALRAQRPEPLPALAFFHIPLPEHETAWAEGWDVRGERREEVCCPRVNSGMFAAFHETGDVLAACCGHDHLNDFDATLWGVHLCYGRAAGFNAYGSDDFPRGARVLELTEGRRELTTWLRLEGGERVTQALRA
jgi:hypothetical protein